MDRQLSAPLRPARRLGWAALVGGVILVHAFVTADVAARLGAVRAGAAMPPRIEVAYVREMQPAEPPPVAAPAAPLAARAGSPALAPRAPRATPAAAASAASAPPADAAASAAAAVERAASAPAEPAVAAADKPVDAASAAGDAALGAASSAGSTVAAGTASLDATSAAAANGPAAAARPAVPQAAASAAGQAFQWPASTRVRYHLTGNYRGAVDGSATVEWIRVGSRYQVHVDFLVGPSFAPVITQRSSSDGEIGAAGLMPHRYDQQVKLLGTQRPLQTVLFDPFGVTLANGERQPAPPNVQDSASQFIQLTYLFSTRPELLTVGGSVDIPLALPKKVDTWTYDMTEQVTLETPFGPLTGLHLVPRNPPGPNALRVEIWFSPQLRYFPARLRFEQNESTWVDLMIEKPPEMAN